MKISDLNLPSVYFNQVEARGELITKGLSSTSFSSLLNSIIVNQNVSTQEDAAQKTSDTSCKCNSNDEMTEVAETEKKGLAACIDCLRRKSGQCELWNGKEDVFDMLIGSSRNTSMGTDFSLSHEQSDFQDDFVAMAVAWLDYNNAYAYVNKKKLGIVILD